MTSSLLFNITTFTYLISMLCFFVHVASRNEQAGTAGSY
ncbi:MAG: c-type cytochrome biogenesis protein CcsB, partial [Geobacteraceae bacterium]|nr:c-type cytochrome biogenesis protein CcsB [Geobacteraceae bacterium]